MVGDGRQVAEPPPGPHIAGAREGDPPRLALPGSRFLLLMVLAMVLSGASYQYRTAYLDLDPLSDTAWRTLRMFLVYMVGCLGWLRWRYGCRWEDLGLRREHLGRATLLGLGVYTLPLAAFLWAVGDPEFDVHFVDPRRGLATSELIARSLLVFAMAAMTDLWSRGFVLLQAARYWGDAFAIGLQNLVWFLLHLYEIELLMGAWGLPLALGVTLFIGIAGDLGVLRYRNVWGLALGHIYLNAVFILYVVT